MVHSEEAKPEDTDPTGTELCLRAAQADTAEPVVLSPQGHAQPREFLLNELCVTKET